MEYRNQAEYWFQSGKKAKKTIKEADRAITAAVGKKNDMEKEFLIDNPCKENKKKFENNKQKLNEIIEKNSELKKKAKEELNKCINELQKLAKKINTDLDKYGRAYKDNAFTAASLSAIDRYAKKQMREAANSAKSKADELSHLFVLIQKYIKELQTDTTGVIPASTPYESMAKSNQATNDFSGITKDISISSSIDDKLDIDLTKSNWQKLLKELSNSSQQYIVKPNLELEIIREEERKKKYAALYYYLDKKRFKPTPVVYYNTTINDLNKDYMSSFDYSH